MKTELEKTQDIRLIDVPLGLFMMVVGHRANLDPVTRIVMIAAGFLTITYNLNNYLKNENSRLSSGQ